MLKIAMAITGALSLMSAGTAGAADVSDDALKIGLITDMSGLYSDIGGPGAVVAAQMAIDDAGGKVLGKPIMLLTEDHQNKVDIASGVARRWIDLEHVDMIAGMNNSSVALAVQKLASEKKVLTMNTGAGAMLTEKHCTPYGIQYTYNTYALATGVAEGISRDNVKDWYLIVVDYAFGDSMANDATKALTSLGSKVIGSVRVPINASDFASPLLQAQSSGADVIALANSGQDLINTIKQANEFSIGTDGKQLVAFLIFLTDVKAMGLDLAQGLTFATAFYWDRTDATRKWSERFYEKHGAMPTMVQAGLYSAVSNYIKAVAEAGTDDSDVVRKKLGEMTINDFFTNDGHIQKNGQLRHDMYLAKAKKPEESRSPWDLLNILQTIPSKQATISDADSECPLSHE